MAPIALLVTIVCVFFVGTSTAQNVSNCFFCQSPRDPECDDVFDITAGRTVQCSTLVYSRSANPELTDVVQNAYIHERLSNTTVNQLFCIKLGLVYNNGTPGILRTCHKQADNVGDPCEFITRETTTLVNVTTISACNYCTEDNCNSAGSIYASLAMVFVSLLLAKNC